MKENRLNIYDRFLMFIEKTYYFFLTVILLLALFNLFYYLKETPIYSWDEARHGASAYEMLKQNQFVVNTYGYKNDYWNLKPPLSFIFIALGYRLSGFNPLGLRLFSAIAAFFTILAVALFARYRHGKIAALIAALVLTTSPKYIVIHSARTGDADSLFVFFFTLSIISAILSEKNIKWLYLSGFSFSLAFLTKSWHAFNIVIIIFLYLALSGRLFKLKIKECFLFFISSVFLILVWGILRYMKDGLTFFKTMINYDLLSRSSNAIEGHTGGYWYYFDTLRSFYLIWLGLLIGGVAFYFIAYRGSLKEDYKGKIKRDYFIALTLWILIPMLIFTNAKTKIGWYILPVYPPIALGIGGLCGALMRGPKRNLAFQLMIMVMLIKGVSLYEPVIVKHIVMFKNDSKRGSVSQYNSFSTIRGARTYIYYGSDAEINAGPKSEFKSWLQSDLLSAEMYWDLIPMDGGVESFLRDKSGDSVLIALKNEESSNMMDDHNFKVIGEDKSFYIFKNTNYQSKR